MKLTELQLGKILLLREQKKTQKEIAADLGIKQHMVSRYLSKFKEHGTINHLGSNGRPKLMQNEIKRNILQILGENPKTSLRKLAKKGKSNTGIEVSYGTVRRILNKNNIYAYNLKKKPLLTPRHLKLRREAAAKWLGLSDSKIKSIIFSDETKFNLRYSDGKVYVWRTKSSEILPEHVEPAVKFGGGSVMVWACFSYSSYYI